MDLDTLAWERCPDCLGRLDAIDVEDGVALSCGLCGYAGQPTELDDQSPPIHNGVIPFPGF